MSRHILAIVRFSSREIVVLLYTYCAARDGEISTSRLCCVMCNFCVGNLVVFSGYLLTYLLHGAESFLRS